MTPERWRQVRTIFDQVVELPAAEQAARLTSLCGDDGELHAEVHSLLSAQAESDGFLSGPPTLRPGSLAALARAVGKLATPRIGPYQVLRSLGEGGQSEAFLVNRAQAGDSAELALKLLKPGMDGELLRSRFHAARAQLLALRHPGLAELVATGIGPDGLPYFVSEYVKGEPLTQFCRRHRLPVRQRLALFLQLCDAVLYLHRHLLVHLRLQPSNILVTAASQVKLLDGGVAPLLLAEALPLQLTAQVTAVRSLLPPHLSPEQVRGLPVTTATDVYALGTLLYELLLDRHLYDPSSASSEGLARAICEQLPEVASLRPRGELKHILEGLLPTLLSALHKDPAQRCSVETLRTAIERGLSSRRALPRSVLFAVLAWVLGLSCGWLLRTLLR